MDNQERNREALVDHIADQDRILRRHNEQIARQAKQIENQLHNAREAQRVIEEQDARNYSLAADLAAAVTRAEKAEDTLLMVQQQRDHLRATLATTARQRDEADKRAATASPRPLTADDGMLSRAVLEARKRRGTCDALHSEVQAIVNAALAEPTRPEGAEDIQEFIEAVTRQSQGLSPAEVADELAASGVRVTGKDN